MKDNKRVAGKIEDARRRLYDTTPLAKQELDKLQKALPGLIGGLEYALIDKIGRPLPFVILLFNVNGGVAHMTNSDPDAMEKATLAYADAVRASKESN